MKVLRALSLKRLFSTFQNCFIQRSKLEVYLFIVDFKIISISRVIFSSNSEFEKIIIIPDYLVRISNGVILIKNEESENLESSDSRSET